MHARTAFSPVRRWRARGLVGAAVAAVVLAGAVQGVPAQAAPVVDPPLTRGAFEETSDDPVPVPADPAPEPPVSYEPVPQPAPPPAVPPGQATGLPTGEVERAIVPGKAAALAEAARTGQPVEITSQTSETSISIAQPDGTVQVQVVGAPVRTRIDGEWVDVDMTLEFTDEGVQPKAVAGDITFSAGDAYQPMAVLGDGEGTSLALDWARDLPTPELEGATATYRNVLPAVDLTLTATRQGFTQHVVVNQRPNASTLQALSSIEFPLTSTGATVTETPGGDLEISDGTEVVGTAAAPVMWDARTDPASGGPAVTEVIGMNLAPATEAGTDSTLTLTPSRAFLTDPATVYPVTIDPTQTMGVLTDTFVDKGFPRQAYGGDPELKSGTYNGGTNVLRSFLKFDVGDLTDSVVQNATLGLYEFHSYSCTPTWVDVYDAGNFGDGTTWDTQPGTGKLVGNAEVAKGFSNACAAGWVDFNLTDWFAFFANRENNKGDEMALSVRASNESDRNGWKRFFSNESYTPPVLTYTIDGNCNQYYGRVVCNPIRDKFYNLTQDQADRLGWPTTNTTWLPGGAFNHFQGGSIYYSNATGRSHVIFWNENGIRDKWASLGWENSYLGYPTSDEVCSGPKPDYKPLRNNGCFVQFQGGAIYSSPNTPPSVVKGGTLAKWGTLGYENSSLGYPITDETCGLRDGGCFNHFEGGSLYGSPATGVHLIAGGIRVKWAALGHENSYLGYPTTDEACGLRGDASGCFNHFQNGSIYSSNATGVHDIRPMIRNAWAAVGWENGFLGFPTSDTQRVAGGWRQEFEGGNIVYDDATGTARVGAGVLRNPTQFQRVTQARTQLKTVVKARPGQPAYSQVKFEWRPYALTLDEGWQEVNAAQHLQTSSNGSVTPLPGTTAWLPVKDEDGGKASELYTWNATSTIPNDGLVQVRACLLVTGKTVNDPGAVRCTAVTQITVDRAGLTGANATADVGPGTVGLLTGAYSVTGRDADVTAPHGGLAATRSFLSNDTFRPGPVGPGWSLSLAVDEAGADYQSLIDRTDSVLITRGDGTQMPFIKESSANPNSYLAEGEESTSGWTLTFNPGSGSTAASYLLKDIDGDKVTFARGDAGTGHPAAGAAATTPFRVVKVEALRGKAGANDQPPAVTNVTYTAAGNPKWLLAPTDAGVACAAPTPAQPAGCRALEFTYTVTNGLERLDAVKLWATGAAATGTGLVTNDTPVTAQTITLASYAYNSAGRLTSVTDPRTGQTVSYSYRTDGRLATITPVGATATWTIGYDTRTQPRLADATITDTAGSGLPAQKTSVRYNLPLNGSTPGLPSFATDEIARWDQKVTPTDLTAVFDPATIPSATTTKAEYEGASLYALDVNGRTVNTANFGGTIDQDTGADQTATWRINTTEYDAEGRGNVIRSLTAGNRDRALAVATKLPAGTSTDAIKVAQATQARRLDTVNVYSTDGKDLLRSYAPARWVVNAAGTNQVSARSRTTTVYDTPANHPAIAGNLHLPVTTTVDAVEMTNVPASANGTDPALLPLDGLRRITTLEYGNDNAWILGTATATRTNPGGGAAEVITRQTFDDRGRTTSSTLPSGGASTNTAATTNTVYYSATNPDAQCKSEAWAGWVCKTTPGGNPSAGFAIPASWVNAYDVYGNVLRTVETGQDVTRTSQTTYDAVGRARRTSVTGTGTDIGQTRPTVETTYTAAGLVEQTRNLNADGTPGGTTAAGTGAIKRSYDAYGRLTSYTDGSGLVTTTTYDAIGRVKTVTNDRGTRTVTYDELGERGSLPTSLAISDVGTFTARYGADGTIVREDAPGGLSATTVTDAAGDKVSLTYRKNGAEWLGSAATINGFDQVDSYRLVTANGTDRTNRYGYDDIGRLTTVTDTTQRAANGLPTGPSCTRRYTFDGNSNRTGLTQAATAGAPAGTCPTSVPAGDSYSYDTADRLLPAGARASLRYDALGRTRVLPSTDTADLGGDVTIDHFIDDLVAKMTQGTKTTNFGLDAAARRTIRTDTGGSHPAISYYSSDDDNPDIVKETDNSYTRNIASFGGLAAVVTLAGTQGATVTMQLANLHGDITATMPLTAATPNDMRINETIEYGEVRTQPTPGAIAPRYGWLGTHQRDASTPGGLTLMGVRLYSANIGRFLSVDPVAGGSANDYEYSYADPINKFDLDGRLPRWMKKAAKFAWKHRAAIALTAATFIPGVGPAAWALRGAQFLKGGKVLGAATKLVKSNQIIRIGRVTEGSPFRVSLGAQRKHWQKLSPLRQRVQPFHVHMERARAGITYNPTGQSRKLWGDWN